MEREREREKKKKGKREREVMKKKSIFNKKYYIHQNSSLLFILSIKCLYQIIISTFANFTIHLSLHAGRTSIKESNRRGNDVSINEAAAAKYRVNAL